MKINYALVSRSLIALLFVVAGIQKCINFGQTSQFIGSLGVPLPIVATLLVILVEVPVALAFAYGCKAKETGYTLIGFTLLVTLIVHKDYFGGDMVNVLKNLAIIGGIMAAIKSACTDCITHHRNNHGR